MKLKDIAINTNLMSYLLLNILVASVHYYYYKPWHYSTTNTRTIATKPQSKRFNMQTRQLICWADANNILQMGCTQNLNLSSVEILGLQMHLRAIIQSMCDLRSQDWEFLILSSPNIIPSSVTTSENTTHLVNAWTLV